ncbi:hypothetical protein BJV78DRAFT_716359 [Lactifluus subvellereus]|nr:hypothetical protein BJV78DRAFT_716359 [Lactifluus subvellereus]
MAGRVQPEGNGSNAHIDERPYRIIVPTTKLLDTNNTARPGLTFQQKAIDDYLVAQVVQDAPASLDNPETPTLSRATSISHVPDVTPPPEASRHVPEKRKNSQSEASSDTASESRSSVKSTQPPRKKKARNNASLSNPGAVDENGSLLDINVQSIDEDDGPRDVDKTQDLKEFFHPVFEKEISNKDGKKTKPYRKCKLCP